MHSRLRPVTLALTVLIACAPAARANWPDNGIPVFAASSNHWMAGTVALPAPGLIASMGSPEAFVVAFSSVLSPSWGVVDEAGVVATGGVNAARFGEVPVGAATGYGPLGPAQTQAAGAVMLWRLSRPDLSVQLRVGRPVTGTWFTVWPDTGYEVTAQPVDYNAHAVVGAVDGGALVGWLDSHTGTPVIYAQRFGEDGSRLWAADGAAITGALPGGISSSGLWMAPDAGSFDRPAGLGAWMAWAAWDGASGQALLHATRVQADGSLVPGLPAGGVVLGSATTPGIAGLVPDGAGGLYLAAQQGTQILGWRLLANGSLAPGWPAGGVNVNVPAPRIATVLVASLATELDVAWSDTTDAASRWNVRAQRILPDGSRPAGWGPAGVQVTSGAGIEMATAVTAALRVGWQDLSTGLPYVLALRADGTPDPVWPAAGTKISDLAGGPCLVDDGHGGVIATWEVQLGDTTHSNTYAQVVSASGRADVPPVRSPLALRLGAPRPNPSAAGARLTLELPRAARVVAEVFDVAGRREAVLVSGALEAGSREIAWDGRDAHGLPAAAGVHLVRVRVEGVVLDRAVVLVR